MGTTLLCAVVLVLYVQLFSCVADKMRDGPNLQATSNVSVA